MRQLAEEERKKEALGRDELARALRRPCTSGRTWFALCRDSLNTLGLDSFVAFRGAGSEDALRESKSEGGSGDRYWPGGGASGRCDFVAVPFACLAGEGAGAGERGRGNGAVGLFRVHGRPPAVLGSSVAVPLSGAGFWD